ncbi:AEC family transporter [Candidatus Bathyarchaeota archaeon]|nr:AEC family transporter [Candidatus Bathyarchaeota archaeon]
MGFLSRKMGVLRQGDERVLSAYVYYFALPALFLVNLDNVVFNEESIRFVFVGIIPIAVVIAVYILLYFVFRLDRNFFYMLVLSTVFGSLAFFGIPFVMFAFPDGGEQLATLSASTISIISVPISIAILEVYRFGEASILLGLRTVAKRLARNPLIISVIAGILMALADIRIPEPVFTPLKMLGDTTATVAIFMLGAFLYGRTYDNLALALKLSLLRMVFLPLIALAVTAFFGLPPIQKATIVIMHGVPVAVSFMVLSERYNFYKETVSALILVSSLGAAVYLNLWLIILIGLR